MLELYFKVHTMLLNSFVGLWPVTMLNVSVLAEVCCMAVGCLPTIALGTLFEVEILLHEHWPFTWPMIFQSKGLVSCTDVFRVTGRSEACA
jgi:hypothetical protein